ASHIELCREVARRFNHYYGREADFEVLALDAIKKMGKKNSKLYSQLRRQFQQEGSHEALNTARALVLDQPNLAIGEKERLTAYLDGSSKQILTEPQGLFTENAKIPGLDGAKMSKSYN